MFIPFYILQKKKCFQSFRSHNIVVHMKLQQTTLKYRMDVYKNRIYIYGYIHVIMLNNNNNVQWHVGRIMFLN